jgi:hypothetical protein
MDINTLYLKVVVYFFLFLTFSFILFEMLTFYKKRQVPRPNNTKAHGVVASGPPYTSIDGRKKLYLENISAWVLPRAFWGAFVVTAIIVIVKEF